jgi:hypothetical protein
MRVLIIFLYVVLIVALMFTGGRIVFKKDKKLITFILMTYFLLSLLMNLISMVYMLLRYDYITNINTPMFIAIFWITDLTTLCAILFGYLLKNSEKKFIRNRTKNWSIIIIGAILLFFFQLLTISDIVFQIILLVFEISMAIGLIIYFIKIYNIAEEKLSKKRILFFNLGFIFIHVLPLITIFLVIFETVPLTIQIAESVVIFLSTIGFLLIERAFWFVQEKKEK